MKYYAELIKAKLQNITGAISSLRKGLIYFRTDVNKVYVDDENVDGDGGIQQLMMEKHLPEARRATKVQLDDAGTGNEVIGTLPVAKGGTGISDLTGQTGLALVVNATEDGFVFDTAGGSGGGTSIERNQTTHGFVELDAIYHDGLNWVKAQADDAATLASYVVTEVIDADNFIAFKFGEASSPEIANRISVNGYVIGQYYFLSDTVAGGAEVSATGAYSCPLFYVENASTVHIQVYRPAATGLTGGGGVVSYNATILNNVTDDPTGIVIDSATAFSATMEYVINRGTNIEYGRLLILTDAAQPFSVTQIEKVGDVGVTFNVLENLGEAALRYTSSDDVAGEMRYTIIGYGV